MQEFRILYEEEEFPLAYAEKVEEAMQGFVDTDVTLGVEFLFVDGEEIRRLNRETRNIDKVTDVLSFPTLDGIKGQAIRAKDYPFEPTWFDQLAGRGAKPTTALCTTSPPCA